ncbi:MAG: hypothetical protein Q4E51_10625, partial [Lachnospiraceae bacterium]|nr:hypothetical protein [Lachnospiraceae bacterium]
ENFVHDRGLTTFDEMAKLKADTKQEYDAIVTKREKVGSQIDYLESLLEAYKEYEPYIKNHKEQWALKGFARKKYERSHIAELTYYDVYREKLKGMIREPDKKITPKAWQKELDALLPQLEETKKPYAKAVTTLASIELLEYNKTDLERMLGNEKRAREKQEQQQNKKRNRNGQGIE